MSDRNDLVGHGSGLHDYVICQVITKFQQYGKAIAMILQVAQVITMMSQSAKAIARIP